MENIDMNTSNEHSASENMSFSKTDDSKGVECEENVESENIILYHKTSMKNNFIRINLRIDNNVVEHPDEYLRRNETKILSETNNLLADVFPGLVKINIKFSIKMKKLC